MFPAGSLKRGSQKGRLCHDTLKSMVKTMCCVWPLGHCRGTLTVQPQQKWIRVGTWLWGRVARTCADGWDTAGVGGKLYKQGIRALFLFRTVTSAAEGKLFCAFH